MQKGLENQMELSSKTLRRANEVKENKDNDGGNKCC